MKIHELADVLLKLAQIFKQGPNLEFSDLKERVTGLPRKIDQRGMAVNLTTLAGMARIDKQQWSAFVKEYGLPLEIRPRDASRDILGKLLKYLEENPEARKTLQAKASPKETEASPELMRALTFLLKDETNGPLKKELDANFTAFTHRWKQDLGRVSSSLDGASDIYRGSFIRLASLQAWRSELLESIVPPEALAFYLEGQNDGVVSHIFARLGCWRSALKSLRSAIENTMQCLYYMDHPVELVQWHEHAHSHDRVQLQDYLSKHPRFSKVPDNLTGLQILAKEYSTLNGAVHASAASFRMTTDAAGICICFDDKAALGKWVTREKHVITGLNLMLIVMFRDKVSGAGAPNLRKAISFSVPTDLHAAIKKAFNVSLYKP